MKFIFACKPGGATDAKSQFSHHVKEEFQRQLKEYGCVTTCDHHQLIIKLPDLDTRDNVRMPLHLKVKGYTPIARPEQENIALKQDKIVHEHKIASLEQKNIENEHKIRELEQQLNSIALANDQKKVKFVERDQNKSYDAAKKSVLVANQT